eukprot:TRINITY_DN5917_c0_g1_i1.p1 TRINITY_DN5917_c0_g1~~TRINITY_DN5917_c0_g1_i1.p1  ORF type:complete len:502 (+),score=108.92 TRINITY_DN5917_c0_g1_i1:242-1747(+)
MGDDSGPLSPQVGLDDDSMRLREMKDLVIQYQKRFQPLEQPYLSSSLPSSSLPIPPGIDAVTPSTPTNKSDEDGALRRFLVSFPHAHTAATAYINDRQWKEQLGTKDLTIHTVKSVLQKGKVIVPGAFDRKKRPIVISRACRHVAGEDSHLDNILSAVYIMEKTIAQMPDGVDEFVAIHDLSNFSRSKNADPNYVKVLAELLVHHYPLRLGAVFCVNAPWYYQLLWKVVRPWLPDHLANLVYIMGSPADLEPHIDKSNRLRCHNGKFDFDDQEWLDGLCQQEEETTHTIHPELASQLGDVGAVSAIADATYHGSLKKQGGWVARWNKRYCVLSNCGVLFYYKSKDDATPEGNVPLAMSEIYTTGSSLSSTKRKKRKAAAAAAAAAAAVENDDDGGGDGGDNSSKRAPFSVMRFYRTSKGRLNAGEAYSKPGAGSSSLRRCPVEEMSLSEVEGGALEGITLKANEILIVTPCGKKNRFAASSVEERDEWVDHIKLWWANRPL